MNKTFWQILSIKDVHGIQKKKSSYSIRTLETLSAHCLHFKKVSWQYMYLLITDKNGSRIFCLKVFERKNKAKVTNTGM